MVGRIMGSAAVLALALPAAAHAQAQSATSGGLAAPGAASLTAAVCADGASWRCARGQTLTLQGTGLDGVQRVTFLGARTKRDDITVRVRTSTPESLDVVVPAKARTGRLRLRSVVSGAVRSTRPVRVVAAPARSKSSSSAAPVEPGGVFPIDGDHDMGQSPANGFGGGRGHEGHDLFARCGTPVVAVRDATVQHVATHARAGNYVVLQDDAGRSYAYMHLRSRALVDKGDRVAQGERVGYVGDTGRASGCHLHFELWTAPGWYTGGKAVDPLPQLQEWERAHTHG